MKPLYIDRSIPGNQTFTIQHLKDKKDYLTVWHYHKELELVVVLESGGMRFVGDNISKFEKGDVVLLGTNLPHLWMFDDFKDERSNKAEILVAHISPAFLELSAFPEFSWIQNFSVRARKGILFTKIDVERIAEDLKFLLNSPPFESMLGLLAVLKYLKETPEQRVLSLKDFGADFSEVNPRLDKVYTYIYSHFREKIPLTKLAELACMNPSSFSRYFKNTHQKTLTRFINEIRIGYASKLMLEKKMSISQIGYESGFNNISNFNRQFKHIMRMSPKEYLKGYEAQAPLR